MQSLSAKEARAVLDAMGIPVAVLRDRADFLPESDVSVDVNRPSESSNAPDARSLLASLAGTDNSPVTEPDMPGKSEASDEVPDSPETHPESTADTLEQTAEVSPAVTFALMSVITSGAQIVVELPEWSGGLLDGRMTAVISDLMRILSTDAADADWQYFRWPIDGVSDQGVKAATEAADAWLHRRWAEMDAIEPITLASMQTLDVSALVSDAVVMPSFEKLLTDVDAKRALWDRLKLNHNG